MLAYFSWINHIIENPAKWDKVLIAAQYTQLVLIILLKRILISILNQDHRQEI